MAAPKPPVRPGAPSVSPGDIEAGINPDVLDLMCIGTGIYKESLVYQHTAAATQDSPAFEFPALLNRAIAYGDTLGAWVRIYLVRNNIEYTIAASPVSSGASVVTQVHDTAELKKPVKIQKGDIIRTTDAWGVSGNIEITYGYVRLRE